MSYMNPGTNEDLNRAYLRVGDIISAGDIEEDRDTGKVISIEGEMVTVAWRDSMQTTTQPRAALNSATIIGHES